jgi:hypothetical protein
MEYRFELTGITSLLMHKDDIQECDDLAEWRKDPANKSLSVKGDDRSPPWTWLTYLHHDGEHLAMPAEVIMATLRKAASKMTLKGSTTYKEISQSGLFVPEPTCRFEVAGRRVKLADLLALKSLPFSGHVAGARDLGFELSVRRVRMKGKGSGNVRVRPQFDRWSVSGSIQVSEPAITEQVLRVMFDLAGRRCGFLDWRPSSKTPGPHGMFGSKLTLQKDSAAA